ncbi:BRO family protein [Niallia taxi]|uniref:Phage antirepressor n=1 Tax=Niallia taxi TaxID=2499688 RepID=A0A437KBE3_9BACI|nr:BRO family protein [Niallia taxi]RVT62786.1 phage antirepressor [Niallia taxi]
MEQIQKLFNYNENPIRTVINEGKILFVAKDVADILGFSETSAMTRSLDNDEKTNMKIKQSGTNYTTNITGITESGLYSAILRSRRPEAKQFRRWITSEVLPSIRKHGSYMTDDVLEQAIGDPDFMIGLLASLKEEKGKRMELEQRIEEDKPKLIAYQYMVDADGLININEFAKHFGIGPRKLFDVFRELKLIYNRRDGILPSEGTYRDCFKSIRKEVAPGKTRSVTLIVSKKIDKLVGKLVKEGVIEPVA